jgi:sec-independent protein translocase protein TatC
MTMIFAFGLCFELPVLLVLLGRVGIVTSKMLAEARRYALLGIFVVAAVVTPPDAFSQIALGVPIYVLYEISILCIRVVEKKRNAQQYENSDDADV